MIKARKRRAVGTKATDAEEEVSRDQLENIIIFQGLKLELESVRRKNPYFKAEHKRGVKMSRREKLSAMSFARRVVEAYFLAARVNTLIVSPN